VSDPRRPFVLYIVDLDGRKICAVDPKTKLVAGRKVFEDRSLLNHLPKDAIEQRLASSEDSESILTDLEEQLERLAKATG
jgi:hypothetical protein